MSITLNSRLKKSLRTILSCRYLTPVQSVWTFTGHVSRLPLLGKVHRYGLLILDQSSHLNVPCIVVPESDANCKDYYSRMRQKSPQDLWEHVQF